MKLNGGLLLIAGLLCMSMSVWATSVETNIDLAKKAYREHKVSRTVVILKDVLTELKETQRQTITTYFPHSFESFLLDPHEQDGEGYGEGYGSSNTSDRDIFLLHYQAPEDDTIDVSVEFSTYAVSEFVLLIDNPSLLTHLDNADIISVNNTYRTLEKSTPSDTYTERNIILNGATLLNIIVNGSNSQELMRQYCQKIAFSKLDQFFSM